MNSSQATQPCIRHQTLESSVLRRPVSDNYMDDYPEIEREQAKGPI